MSDKKSQHILSIQQALAEFDIETQVRRMTLQVMDSYALGNKQAFSYIKEWETKFIDFQGRLSAAENYYRNIQINVNSKIEVTHAVNQRLQKFAEQFWSGMKQSAESVEQMRKNYMNLVKQAGTHASTLRSLQKQIRQTNSKIQIINSNFNEQTTKLVQKISKNQDQIILRNNQRRSESQNILVKMSQAKAQLNSKTQILDELCKDLNLYKNEKVSINSQIASIYEQLNNRVLISDFNQIRIYIDNGVNQTTLKMQQNYKQLKQQIEAEVKIRKLETQQQSNLRLKLKQQIQIQIKSVKENIQDKHEIVTKSIQQLTNKAQKNYKQNWQRITKNTQRIQKIENSIEQINIKIQQILANLQTIDNHIQQVESNILSINQILKQIQKQNYSRGQQLAKLKVDADDKGDIGQQMKKIAQRVLAHDELVRKVNEETNIIKQKLQNYNTSILMRMNDHQIKNNQQFSKLNFILKSQTEHINTKYDKRCQIIEKNVEDKHRQVLQSFSNTLASKIDSMKDKFAFLQNVSSDMAKFKQLFQQQLNMNDQLNKQIKQKMDRMFGMFTKLKSDLFLKIQAICLDIGKNTTKLKQNSNTIVDLCFLASQFNQIISTLLCVELWREVSQDKQSNQQYKIASMLQGWVLEVLKDKARYRGQYTTRRALIQISLEHHVKTGDKIKGSLIENGGNEEYQQLKRRSISRKKQRQSELPKVYR